MKQFGSRSKYFTEFICRTREETPSVRGTPPYGDSQPIPSVWFDDELQLTEMESPYLTTTLGGITSIGQEALTGFPISTHSTDYVASSASRHV